MGLVIIFILVYYLRPLQKPGAFKASGMWNYQIKLKVRFKFSSHIQEVICL